MWAKDLRLVTCSCYEWKTDCIQRPAALNDLWGGHWVQSGMPCVWNMVAQHWSADRLTPTRRQLALVEWFIPVISTLLGPLGGISRGGILSLLALSLLCWSFLASQVFMTRQDPGKLFCSDLEELTCFFCQTHWKILPLELEPNCHSQDPHWPIPWLMFETRSFVSG